MGNEKKKTSSKMIAKTHERKNKQDDTKHDITKNSHMMAYFKLAIVGITTLLQKVISNQT